ncbi:amidohydrolase [Nannocystis sp. SCPEA4]|uniref:amidohydrolase n=1 Tax=Nannocystis sp. SCPEA4 TaxID=2996787 RepID=UPI00226E4423|nr:amidohydrolase [Nannocystis sp. SCPEA4]MCY1059834.1 amidohydrolase [Nannocystis sp. SCPEA4]
MIRLVSLTTITAALLSCSYSYSAGAPNQPSPGRPTAGKPARQPSTGKPARSAAVQPQAPDKRPPTTTPRPPTRPVGPARATATDVDRVFHGGPVITMRVDDAGNPVVAEALAVHDGEIVAVGTRADVLSLAGAHTEKIDLAGKALLPGFIDGHGHLGAVATRSEQVQLAAPPLGTIRTIAALQRALRADIKRRKLVGGQWVVGWNYDESRLPEARQLTRADLDAVSTMHPIVVYHRSGQLAVVNTPALRLLGIDAGTADPPGGLIGRKPRSREPSGELEDSAVLLVTRALPRQGDEEQARRLIMAERQYARRGFTTVQDAPVTPDDLEALRKLARAGKHVIDVVAYPVVASFADAEQWVGQRFGAYERGLKLGGIELVLDGVLDTRTAWLSTPYATPPPGKPRGWRGEAVMEATEVEQILELALDQKWQVVAHADGDAAADQFLDAWERVLERRRVKDRRPVLLRAQTVREDQLDRMRDIGMVPSFASAQIFHFGDFYRDTALGPTRAARLDPARSALDRGLLFTLQTDAPLLPLDPMQLLAAAVVRTTRSGKVLGPPQRIPVFDGLRGLTSSGAHQLFDGDKKGELTVGRAADLVILDRNPLSVRTADLKAIRPLATYHKGAPIHEAKPPQ